MTTEQDATTADAPRDGGQGGSVARLRRPPVRQTTLVRSDREHTFAVFVRTIGVWWPVRFSAGGGRVRDITIEERAGGRVFETWDDGTTVPWGEIRAWDPPERFVMSWLGTPEPTEVELSFTDLGPRLTRVAVEHRGWEALSESQLAEDCALPGGYTGGAYVQGWARILAHLAPAVEADLHPGTSTAGTTSSNVNGASHGRDHG